MLSAKRLLVAGAALAALAAATVLSVGTASAESNGGVRIMPLGDSLTEGLSVAGGYRIDLWSKLVAGGYKVDFVGSMSNGPSTLGDHDHEGHSGWTIAQIDANVGTWLPTYTPRTILLHIGTNDIYGSDPAGAPARLGTLLDHITTLAPNAEVFVAQIIPVSCCDATVRTYNAAIPGLVQTRVNAGKHLHLVDMYSALSTADLLDGIHPGTIGYGKMATVWYNALLSVPGSLTGGTTGSPSPGTSSASPSPSRSPSPSARPSSAGPGGCRVTYTSNAWNTGLTANITIASTAATPVNGWALTFTLPSGQTITSGWNATYAPASGAVGARNVSYNAAIPAGGSTSIGFQASHTGNSASPTAFALNGAACTIA
ncbi:cellulose binding domain-containing protein [Dactylosporangium sp. CA-233914]|uniref:cellulose binding domain-containing protein n=1 Tax=Dactylosporangium sp. CA-233914 TaxID=3239934 RepID=UPI003D8FBCE3